MGYYAEWETLTLNLFRHSLVMHAVIDAESDQLVPLPPHGCQ